MATEQNITARVLCSVWDMVHFIGQHEMTAEEIAERFGKKMDSVRRWRRLAERLKLPIKVRNVNGVKLLYCDDFECKLKLEPWFDKVRERNGSEREAASAA